MLATLNDYVKAGAIASLVNHHEAMGGRTDDWIQTTAFAYREFRSATPDTVEALIRMARASEIAAKCQNELRGCEVLDRSLIPGTEG